MIYLIWLVLRRGLFAASLGLATRPAQLYNLADDIGETKDLAAQHPDRVKDMLATLQRIQQQGRSRP